MGLVLQCCRGEDGVADWWLQEPGQQGRGERLGGAGQPCPVLASQGYSGCDFWLECRSHVGSANSGA